MGRLSKVNIIEIFSKFVNVAFRKLHLMAGLKDWLKVTVLNFKVSSYYAMFEMGSKWMIFGHQSNSKSGH